MKKRVHSVIAGVFIVACLVAARERAFAVEPCYLTVNIGSESRQILDTDCDGVPDEACIDCTPSYGADNCPTVPNGPEKGTCITGKNIGEGCSSDRECGFGGICSTNQEDSDGDGYGDACDYCIGNGYRDYDGDGICDGDDNCPYTPNPDQKDSDRDGKGDVCTNGLDKIAPLATFKGSWYEIGRQVGQTYPDYLIEFGSIMGDVLEGYAPPDWPPQRYYDEIYDLVPQSIKDHLQGMAAGLSEVFPVSYDYAWDIVLKQNMATELLNMTNMSSIPQSPEATSWIRGCTAFAVSSEAGAFICHNTDAQTMGYNMSTVMYWQPDNGDNAYLTIDPPGWADVAFGLNDKGIAVTMNAGSPNVDALIGLPNNFMIRNVMEHASTLEEAVNYFQSFIDNGNNFGTGGAIVHLFDFNQSTMAKIQVRSAAIDVSYGQVSQYGVSYIASTNHYVGDFNPEPDYYSESSFVRYDRLLELLENTQTFDLDACWAVLSDTNGGQANKDTISCKGGFGGASTVFGTVHASGGLYYVLGRPDAYLTEYSEPQFVGFRGLPDVKYFRAMPQSNKVVLSWKTKAGARNAGFNLYRTESQGGDFVKINDSLIQPVKSSPAAALYEFADTAVQNRETYYYKLEEIDLQNVSIVHGTVSATPLQVYDKLQ
ncbi:MAG: C45 family autoproteolytic acyltransferase/hydrolase [Proteobacteria bacterium]|nr:C45 family autoproteolytic acyltransferase/hydrolase [Pseudomonadota bacterium]